MKTEKNILNELIENLEIQNEQLEMFLKRR
jgi:hypothetical protein